MRATFKVLFYVNRSKEKGGTTRLSVSGRVPRKCPHHGTSYNQRNIFKVVGKANDFKKFSCERSIYLMTERNLKQSTAWMACMLLKGVIIRAHNNGLIPRRSALGTLA